MTRQSIGLRRLFAKERSMKHGIKMCALAVMLVATGIAITQQPAKDEVPKDKTGPTRSNGRVDILANIVGNLKLNVAQKAKVERILAAHEEKLRELFKKVQEAEKDLDEEALSELKAVLKKKQFERVEDDLKKGPLGKDLEKMGKGAKASRPDKTDDAAMRDAIRQITAEVRDSLRQLVGKRVAGKCAD
jgi:hypothetical protein